MRRLLGFLGLPSLLLGLAALGCAGDESSSSSGGEPGAPSSGGDPGKKADPGPIDPAAVDASPLAMTHLLSGFDWQTGFARGAKQRVFALEPTLSSSLARVTVAKIDGTNAEVTTLPVKGKVPTGRIEAIAYDAGRDVFAAIVRAMRPHRLEVVTIAIGATEATFETLAQPSPLAPDGAMFTALYPKGGGSFLAVRGNDLLTLTAGAQATWSAPVPANGFYRGNSASIVLDAPRGRLIGYGRDVYDPVTKTVGYEPSIGTMSLSGPYAWTELSLASAPPADPQASYAPRWAALDPASPRLLAIVPVKSTCGPMECMQQSLWAADLAQGGWTKLLEHYNPSSYYAPWAVDDDGRRIFGHGDGQLWSVSMDQIATAKEVAFAQKGDLGPQNPAAATVLANGKILSTDGGAFRVYDPSSAAPRWERFGKTTLPQERRYRPTMVEDPATGEVLVFGGASSNASPASQALLVLSKDGATIAEESVTGAPPARVGHGSALVERTLVIAGGSEQGASGKVLDDVWTFDRTSRAWKKIGALPKALSVVAMHGAAKGSSEVLAIGYAKAGADDATIAPIVAIDVASGKARELKADGPAPTRLWSTAPLGTCFVGFESGDTVDGSEPQLWRCKREGDVVRWEKTPFEANDYALGGPIELRGAGAPDGSKAYFVGRTMWLAAPKK